MVMALEDYQTKESVVVVFTGDGKGKTSAGLGLLVRSLGHGSKVAFIQFVKAWEVSEHKFMDKIKPLFDESLTVYQGGKGFYNLGELSAKNVSQNQHREAAQTTYSYALDLSQSGDWQVIICDEILTAVQEGLLTKKQLELLIKNRAKDTSLCLTGRGFPEDLLDKVDIATNMTKLKHHFDNNFLANKGIDY